MGHANLSPILHFKFWPPYMQNTVWTNDFFSHIYLFFSSLLKVDLSKVLLRKIIHRVWVKEKKYPKAANVYSNSFVMMWILSRLHIIDDAFLLFIELTPVTVQDPNHKHISRNLFIGCKGTDGDWNHSGLIFFLWESISEGFVGFAAPIFVIERGVEAGGKKESLLLLLDRRIPARRIGAKATGFCLFVYWGGL